MIELLQGDCLEIMPTLPAQSFDAIIADIPYGATACSWDTVIPFAPMWQNLKRLAKPRAAIVLFGSQPFTSALVASNFEMFKYAWYWKKERGTGFATSNKRPLMIIEDVCVFYNHQPTYNPYRKPLARPYKHVLPKRKGRFEGELKLTKSIIDGERVYKEYTHDTPHQLIEISRDNGCKNEHPTQKPVALMEYLIRTYTNEGDTVLDFTMGSGTTMVAAVNTNRNGVGIELREDYYNIAQRRVQEAQAQMVLI